MKNQHILSTRQNENNENNENKLNDENNEKVGKEYEK